MSYLDIAGVMALVKDYINDTDDAPASLYAWSDEISMVLYDEVNRLRTELEKVKKELESHKTRADRLADGILFSPEEFMTLATFAMVNDQPEQTEDIDIDTLHSVLDQIAIKSLGCNDWIEAYHKF